jgi:hypothetical protein
MSKISLAPDASGSGIFTIASPNSNTNRTLTLPDDTGTIVTNSGNQAGSFTTLNTSGAVVFNDAGADVDFRVEGDTEANLLFVDASAESIGVGTSSPNLTSFQRAVTLGDGTGSTVRHAYEINGGQSSAESSIGDFNVYNKGTLVSRMLTVRGSADNSGVLTFYTSNAGTSAERMRLTSDGYLRLAGGGIQFNGDTAAANALDDYEEGTWTPSDQSGAGLTLTNAQGKYTKIGRQVTAWGWVEYPSTANGTNNQIGGLPFSIANSNPDRGGGMIGYKTDSTVVTLRGENNGTLFQFKDSTGGNITNATLSTDVFFFAITYTAA